MCGIAGFYGNFRPAQKEKALVDLAVALGHRGPDGHGAYTDGPVSFVHTRLSIIDLSANGNQPLYNEDKSLVLICNGEIYNYKQLRADLLGRGHKFRSTSDSEVIIHLYEEYSNEPVRLLNQLTGMFAFALWDIRNQQLFIARDRIGIKPLYYSWQNGKLVFASEVKPIAASGLVNTQTDYTSLYEYFLTGSIPGPNTIYKEVKCLEPGHYAVLAQNNLSVHQYWDIPTGLRKWGSEQEVVEEVEKLLSEVVKDHLVADVPVGTFLSAGVDSSLIAAIAAKYHPGIYSFTAAFPGEPEDEGFVAAETAKKLGTTHHSYELKGDFFNDFVNQFRDIDQPFAISSALSLGRISKIARQSVKVVLSGDGADELFGGYTRHEFPVKPPFLNYIPGPLQNSALKLAAGITGKKSLERLRQNLALTDGQIFLSRITVNDPATVLSLFSPGIIAEIDQDRLLRRLNSLFDKRKGEDPLNRVLYVDMKTTLVDEMLTKCDRMTMINGIEGRVPFLDHRLVALAFKIPGGNKRKNGVGKIVLRELLAKMLGKDLAYRAKTGFNSPLQQWLASDKETVDFVGHELVEVSRLDFINTQQIEAFEKAPGNVAAGLIFSLACLNHFFSE
jgi:asparagine synthase (glutamine-hydrolysing)